MKVYGFMFSFILMFALCGSLPLIHDARGQGAGEKKSQFATRREFSMGGIGMISKNLYVVVKSEANERNELIVKPTAETEKRWHGQRVDEPEVAVFYQGEVWSFGKLPTGFDLSNSVIVSFERDKVRFFDFHAMYGAYYERIRN